jgi:hypothetical protein
MDMHMPQRAREIVWQEVADDFVIEYSRRMLMSLPRRDQRENGELYISGLLSPTTRKSMRSIASTAGGGAAVEQRLHHFISKSSWDWRPVRRALAADLEEALDPLAWVVKPVTVLKAGEHTVGVTESFDLKLGRVVNSQRSYSVWLANDTRSAPVSSRLALAGEWLDDAERKRRAKIPDWAGLDDGGVPTAAAAVLELVRGRRLPSRPVVVEARGEDVRALVHHLSAARVPFVLRISGATRLVPYNAVRDGSPTRPVPAQHLAERAELGGRQLRWAARTAPGERATRMSSIDVVLPGSGLPLQLVGMQCLRDRKARELWLSNMADVPALHVARLGRLTERVEQDFTDISTKVGALDFTGRSYGGWHRHTTLSAVAHAIVIQSAVHDQEVELPVGDRLWIA